jgi:hypothetical protein
VSVLQLVAPLLDRLLARLLLGDGNDGAGYIEAVAFLPVPLWQLEGPFHPHVA